MPVQVSNPYASHPAAGGGGVTITVTGASISDTGSNPNDGTAGLRVNRDGTIDRYRQNLSGYSYLNDWADPAAADVGDDYEVRLTVNSGASPTHGNTTGTWLALSAARYWWLNRSTLGTSTAEWLIEIRDVATQTLQDSDTFSISATKAF